MTHQFVASATKTMKLPSIHIGKTVRRVDLWEKNQICNPGILSYICISVIVSGTV